jgi:hypothetical protein
MPQVPFSSKTKLRPRLASLTNHSASTQPSCSTLWSAGSLLVTDISNQYEYRIAPAHVKGAVTKPDTARSDEIGDNAEK